MAEKRAAQQAVIADTTVDQVVIDLTINGVVQYEERHYFQQNKYANQPIPDS